MCDFTKTNAQGEITGLDKIVLSALYPDNKVKDMSRDTDRLLSMRKAQMRLALMWDRIDFAQDVIFDVRNPDYKKVC